jgi:menaquinol-cytochrome c reductase iron-sulfur subunit
MKKSKLSRKEFLEKIIFYMAGIAGAAVSVPFFASLAGPLLTKTKQVWRDIGYADHFKTGKTILVTYEDADPLKWAGTTAKTAAWLRKESENKFTAFSVNCTHLGCPVRWIEGSELFLCPCHGGVYYKNGTVASGPPPKSLTQYKVRVNKGKVEILTHPTPITTI